MTYGLLAAILLLRCSQVGIASDLLDSVAARIHPAPVLRGEFAQQRTLAGFSKPLRSAGTFVAARDLGVLWTTTAPFPGELVITETSIRERVDGKVSEVVEASREPALRQVNRILLALLQGQVATLREQFSATGTIGPERWQLELTPSGQLAEVMGRVELSGSDQIEMVAIHEHNGDVSRVEFTDLTPAEALSTEEISRFD